MAKLNFTPHIPFDEPLDATLEVGAYEEMWKLRDVSFKKLAVKFRSNPGSRPSHFVDAALAIKTGKEVLNRIRSTTGSGFNVRLHGELEYPDALRDAVDPIELLYFQGSWGLLNPTRSVAVVGTRKPSEEGVRRARQIVRKLVLDGFTIVSGLADGIDTVAHTTAIESYGQTIAVIGTPLGQYYPEKNRDLQNHIAANYLLISQIPVERYAAQSIQGNRLFFPERNKTMSALTAATIIIEASETSGTLVQADAAIKQGRKLFILNSCFERKDISWPIKFEKLGAIRVRDYEDVRRQLVD